MSVDMVVKGSCGRTQEVSSQKDGSNCKGKDLQGNYQDGASLQDELTVAIIDS
jgi:hypothetical protein